MAPIRSTQSRYAITTKRTLIARQAALAALVLAPTLAACGDPDDAAVFESAATLPTADTTVAPTTPAQQATTQAPTTQASTTVADSTTTTATAPETAPPVADTTFPDTAEVAVSFTFSPSGDERIENPYIAVWVEDLDGNLVKTISLWYEQSNKGQRWLSDLRQWAAASGETVDPATSGATQVAGDYTVVWDGTDADGAAVELGDYVLFIEAAREHGPYELTSSPISIASAGFAVTLADNGELTNASAEMRV